jgi:hypothetical protein
MRFMMIVKASQDSEAGKTPDPSVFEAMRKYNQELVRAGVLLAAEGLHPSSLGHRIEWKAGRRTVVDGPFTETKELIAGFWLIQVKSREEALEWAKRVPNPMNEDGAIELRRVFDAGELPGDCSPPART